MKIFILLFLFIYSSADSVKNYAISCETESSLETFLKKQKILKNSLLPKDCFFLTKNAKIKVIALKENQIIKILIIDINKPYYSLRKDIIIKDNKNLKYY